jgi:chromosome partitioning protein
MKILAIYSNKGGVGKTAAAVNLSYLASQAGFKTLLCDLDPQGSATYYFRIKPKLKSGAKGLIKGGKKAYKNIKGTDYEKLDLLPADISLRNFDITLNKYKRSKKRLNKILTPFKDEYDLIVLDCPVTISILAENIFNAVDNILVPMIPTTLSVRTHRQLLTFCKRKGYDTEKIHTFFSMVDMHKKMHKELMLSASTTFINVLENVIPYLAQIENMGIHREPVTVSSPASVASKAYQGLWNSVEKIISAEKMKGDIL